MQNAFSWLPNGEPPQIPDVKRQRVAARARKQQLYRAIHAAFPDFKSAFEDYGSVYVVLPELSRFAIFQLHQEALWRRFFDFVHEQYAQANDEVRYFFDVGPLSEWLPPYLHRYFSFSLQQLALQHLSGPALVRFAEMAEATNAS